MLSPIKKVSILGCGWLGFSLAVELIQAGYLVSGSTTSEEKLTVLRKAGIQPYLIQVGEQIEGQVSDFFKTDVLVLNIPPGRRRTGVEERFPAEIQLILERALKDGLKRLIFISSTSVYEDVNREVTETEDVWASKGSGLALVRCEQYLGTLPDLPVTILRLAGLVGGDRKAGRFLAGKKNVTNGAAPVNMVHRDDVVAIIKTIIQEEVWGETFNVCADEHPSRKEFYTGQAEKEGFEPPVFVEDQASSYKIVSNRKLKKELRYTFLHPDPIKF